MVLPVPLLVTAPEAEASVMVPSLAPTKPPMVLLAPVLVTAPEAEASVMVPSLAPTKPPTVLLAPVPVTVPEAVESSADGAVVRSDQAPRDAPRPDGDVAARL